MRRGVVISGSAHLIFLAAALIGLPEFRDDTEIMPAQVTDVSIVSLSDFQASRSSAPAAPEEPEAALNAPVVEPSEAATPETETALPRPDTSRPDAPDAGEAPDLSALDTVAPSVELNPEAPEGADTAAPLGIDTPLPNAPAQDGSVNSDNLALLAPERPNLAPRIDTTAAPKPPKPAPEAPEAAPDVAPEPAPEPEPEPTPEVTPAAPKEATTEITPDAVEQENPTTPKAAARPRGRPADLAAKQEQRKKEAEAAAAAAKEAEAKAEAEAQAAAEAKPEPTPAAQETGQRLGQDFNSSEARAIGDVIGKSWNKTLIEGKDQYERLVITVRVKMTAGGKVMGAVEPVKPRSPNGDFKVAFEAARRAILRAQPIPLPASKFRDGDFLEIRFDPGRSTISLD